MLQAMLRFISNSVWPDLLIHKLSFPIMIPAITPLRSRVGRLCPGCGSQRGWILRLPSRVSVDALFGRWHRKWDGNPSHLQNQRGIPRQNHEHILRRPQPKSKEDLNGLWNSFVAYYLGIMFSSTFKERYLNFLFRLVNKIYKHFNLHRKNYNLSAILSLCIKLLRNAIT